jgi:hypothetical protein
MPCIGPTVAKRVGRTFPRRTLRVFGDFLGHDFYDSTSQVAHSFPSKSLGVAAPDRQIFAFATNRGGPARRVVKVTLVRAGHSDLQLMKVGYGRNGDSTNRVELLCGLAPEETEGEFVIEWTSATPRSQIAWGFVTGAEEYGARLVPALFSDEAMAQNFYSDLRVDRDSFGAACSLASHSGTITLSAPAWTGFDASFMEQVTTNALAFAGATKTFEQKAKIPCAVEWTDPTPNQDATAVFAVWRPKSIDQQGAADALAALRAGGVNMVNHMYVEGNYGPDIFNNEFGILYQAGARHIRLPLGMNTLEDGTTGNLREDRWLELKKVVNAAKAEGLVTLICVVNTFEADFESDPGGNTYMGFLTTRAARHLELVTQLAQKINDELDLNWVVYQPFNEPLFDHGGGEEAVWYDHQDNMVPAIRAVAPTLWLFVGAHRNQAIWATRGTFSSNGFLFKGTGTYPSWWDDKCIVDFHYYRPNPLTHCSDSDASPTYCPINTWPGTYNGVRSYDNVTVNGTWDAAQLADDIGDAAAWAAGLTPPLTRMHISELGAKRELPADVTGAYLKDLCDACAAHGIGWSVWDWYQTFRIKDKPAAVKAAFRG